MGSISNLGRKGGKNIAAYRTEPFAFSHFINHSGNAIEILPSVDGNESLSPIRNAMDTWIFSARIR